MTVSHLLSLTIECQKQWKTRHSPICFLVFFIRSTNCFTSPKYIKEEEEDSLIVIIGKLLYLIAIIYILFKLIACSYKIHTYVLRNYFFCFYLQTKNCVS